eukprot:IDg12613t1
MMRGDAARASARRDGAGAPSSVDLEEEMPASDVASAAAAQASDDEEQAAFRRRSAFFEDAERSFKALTRAMEEHKAALVQVADSGTVVAEKLHNFFTQKDSHSTLAASFLSAQRSARENWNAFEERYDQDVLLHIRNRLDEIPQVREGIKQRANALTEMKRLQRKTASERKLDGPFAKAKQRRRKELKDVSAVYSMHHSDVMRKFSNIERNFGNFVSPALVALVSLLAEISKYTVNALEDVQKQVAIVPPMTHFDDPMMSPSSSHTPVAPTLSLQSESSAPATHSRARSEPSGGAPVIAAYATTPEPVRRRVFLSADTASLPEVLNARSCQFGAIHGQNANGTANHAYTDTANSAPAPNSDSVSSGERVAEADGEAGSITGNGTVSEPQRSRQDTRERRRRREGMGSSDTVPSESGTGRPGVLMRVRVLYDFSPREVNEIELRKGDVVEVREKTDPGWWTGRCRRRTGLFPRNYTRELT